MKMKLMGALAALLLTSAVVATAQEKQDVVYLKNGSVFHGTVVEFIPGRSITIENEFGDRLICPMDDVEKMQREETTKSTDSRSGESGYPAVGYRGFVDGNILIGAFATGVDRSRWGGFVMMTTHGYQINERFFVGAGIGIGAHGGEDCDYEDSPEGTYEYACIDYAAIVPIYGAFRTDFRPEKITPFAEARIGGVLGDQRGALVNLTCGMRFNRFNMGIGYLGLYGSYYSPNDACHSNSVVFRLGVDIGRHM